jgi:hypothetical protein
MQHIHARDWLGTGAAVQVECDHQCNVLVMDDHNYTRYRRGQSYRYLGWFFKRLPAVIGIPSSGHWNTVIDLAGGRADIQYAINYLN